MKKLIIYLVIISFSLFGLADGALAKGGSHSSSSHRSSSTHKSTKSTTHRPASHSTSHNSSVRSYSSTKHYSTTLPKSSGNVSVHSYTKRDGTFVPAHHRSHPDSSFNNNWTTVGNVNPYTGKEGTKTHQ
jgi:hypothetical protein